MNSHRTKRRPRKKKKVEHAYDDFQLAVDYTLEEAKDILAKAKSVRAVVPKIAYMPFFSARVAVFLNALVASPNVTRLYVPLDPRHEPGYFYIGEMYERAPMLKHVTSWTFDYVSTRGESVLAQCLVHRVCKNAPAKLEIRTSLSAKSSSPACLICSLREGLSLAELPTTRRVDMSGMQLRETVELDPGRAFRIASNYCLVEFQFPHVIERAAGEYDESYFYVYNEVAAIVERNIKQKQ